MTLARAITFGGARVMLVNVRLYPSIPGLGARLAAFSE